MPRPKTPCAFCGKKAEYLCDYIITVAGLETSEPITCDTPLCKSCRVSEGFAFACTINPGISYPKMNGPESWDYCPSHTHYNKGNDYPVAPMAWRDDKCQTTQNKEVEQWREEHRVAIARYCISKVDNTKPKPELLWAVYNAQGSRLTMAWETSQEAVDDALSQTTDSWPQLKEQGCYLTRVTLKPGRTVA